MAGKIKKIIFSLDDFGISQKANENILKLAEAGKIGRVSVMSHGTIRKEDADRLLATGIKLDAHMDMRNSINPNRKLKDGVIKRAAIFGKDYFIGGKSPRFIEKQWAEQIEKFQNIFGKNPDGINSHEHSHFFPPYFKVSLKLSEKYGIKYVRLGKKTHWGATPVSWILNFFRRKNMKSFLKSRLSSSDLVLSFDWIENLSKLKNYPGDGEIEVIFHPERDEEMAFLEKLD